MLLEVQTSRDEAKVRTVPLGLELALARHPGVPGDVVLVTVGMDVARFFDRHPFEVPGPLGTTRRLDVVRIDLGRTDPSTFLDPRRPYLAPLAVAAALGTPRLEEVTMKALRQAGREPAAQRDASRDAIFWLVGPSAAKKVGTMWKNYEFRSMFFKREVRKQTAKALARALPKAMAKGEVRYARAAVLRVLAARRIPATAEQRRRVGAERDLARLNRWLEAAARARRASDVFADA